VPVLPITTERLTLRMMRSSDAAVLAAYRGLPEVAEYQDWDMPYGLADAERNLAAQQHWDDVTAGQWVQVAIEHEGTVVGDVAVGMVAPGVAHIGYTLAPEQQGHGYASEAAEAVVDALFAHTDVVRVVATLDPRNTASMRVVEQLGFTYEGLARRAELIRGEWLDDMRFAVLKDERAAWKERPRARPSVVKLVEIANGEARAWARLETHRFQRQFVATVLESFADALHPPESHGAPLVPWHRGIEADGQPVGFVMMSDVSETEPHPFLWRLLIDRWHQRRGIAIEALRQLIEHLRSQGRTQLFVSYVEAPGGPEPLYRSLGFVPNGEFDEDETIAVLTL
jgi:RimJ/RimL family protein N-acetyltransferase